MTTDRAIQQAARSAAAAVGLAGRGRTDIETDRLITRFDRHPDGYLHARVEINGRRYYFHRKFGSWLAPGTSRGGAVLKEPEGLLGSVLGGEIKYALSRRSQPFDLTDRREREKREEAKRATQPRAGDEAVSDAGLQERPDRSDARPQVPPDGDGGE